MFTPNLATTGIGSVPCPDADSALSMIEQAGLSVPFWPQLPKRSFLEGMIPQYSEGMPCVRVDRERETTVFDVTDKSEELQAFYEKYLLEDPSLFAISPEYCAGFPAFEKLAGDRQWPSVKGHVTGPITFSTSVCDESKKPLYGDPDLRDAAVKALTRKAEWQIRQLKKLGANEIVIFVDEPALAAYGSSAYIYISENDVIEMLGEVFGAVRAAGAIPGLHVCGNSDWGVMLKTGVQILNFDAYQYGRSLSLYGEPLAAFIEQGGCIAWGIVPTTDAIAGEDASSLLKRFEASFQAVVAKGVPEDSLRAHSLLTPSCGAGSLNPQEATRAFELLAEVHRSLA